MLRENSGCAKVILCPKDAKWELILLASIALLADSVSMIYALAALRPTALSNSSKESCQL